MMDRRSNPTMLVWLSLFAGLLAGSVRGEPPAQGRKPLAIEDLYRLDSFITPVLASEGKQTAFVRSWIDTGSKQERFSLWLADEQHKQGRSLEKGEPDARHPLFSPDGKWLVFL